LLVGSLEFIQKKQRHGNSSLVYYDQSRIFNFCSIDNQKPESFLGDFKRFTSNSIIKAIQENPRESRKEFLLEYFKKEVAKSSNTTNFKFWRMTTSRLDYVVMMLFSKK